MSISQAKRLIKQGAIKVNGKIIKDLKFKLKEGDKIQIGKRIFGTAVKNGNKS